MNFKTSEQLFSYLLNIYKPGDEVNISSYGMYLGVSKGIDWGDIYKTYVRDFINKVNKGRTKIIIGLPYYIECKPGCNDCKIKYNNVLKRHLDTSILLNLNIRYHSELHLKYYNIGDVHISGGFNLNESNYIDWCVLLNKTDGLDIKSIFNKTWRQANSDITYFYR